MNRQYELRVTENDITTSIIITVPGGRASMQVTTADKGEYAMVYVWADVDKKSDEHRCATHEEARQKAWELARKIGEEVGRVRERKG